MSTCKFCGLKSRLFSSYHTECKSLNAKGRLEISTKLTGAIVHGFNLTEIDKDIASMASRSRITSAELIELRRIGFENAVEHFIEGGILPVAKEQNLLEYQSHYALSADFLNKNNSVERIVKAAILRDIIEGIIPERKVTINGTLPFLLQRGESVIWVFENVELFEKITETFYRGGSFGSSIKVAKGIYLRGSSFSSQKVKIEKTRSSGRGYAFLTNKSIYFSSKQKVTKIPYKNIVSLFPYADSIGILKNGSSAKPMLIKDLDGWFAYNAVSNLVRI